MAALDKTAADVNDDETPRWLKLAAGAALALLWAAGLWFALVYPWRPGK